MPELGDDPRLAALLDAIVPDDGYPGATAFRVMDAATAT
jgi:hypothetical protein